MKSVKIFYYLLFAVLLTGLASCSSTRYASSYPYDDLYGTHDRLAIAEAQQRKAEVERAEAEARLARAEAARAQRMADYAEYEIYDNSYQGVLADSYDSAYARRLRGFSSPTYKMPASYYNYRYSDAYFYASAFDPAFYNIIVMGDEVWVEPKYVTAMFGNWGSSVNISFGWGRPYWGWGYGYGYNYWHHPYYNYWGYPYNYWGWNYPYYGGGYWHHNHYKRPNTTYRPSYGNNTNRPSTGGNSSTVVRNPNSRNPNTTGTNTNTTVNRNTNTSGSYRNNNSATTNNNSSTRYNNSNTNTNSNSNTRYNNNSSSSSTPRSSGSSSSGSSSSGSRSGGGSTSSSSGGSRGR